jgi:molybdopterin synthase catalytic subunit
MTTTLVKDIEQLAQQAAMKFPSEVVRIRHYIGHDWAGDPSITFRIVLSDAAAAREHLTEITEPIKREIFDELVRRESEYYPYFEFRSKTEYDALKDPTWD